MKLQECDLDISGVVSRPLIRSKPEEEWLQAKDHEIIPDSLFEFYCRADYFSFGKAPRFLSDPEKLLFPFVSNVARGILDSCIEAEDLLTAIRDAHQRMYTPVKRMKGVEWDAKASLKSQRSFKYLVLALSGILDQFAEIAAILFHPQLQKLTPGRSSFDTFKDFAEAPLHSPDFVVTAKTPLIEKLHEVLRSEIVVAGPEECWLDLLVLYRNKIAHLGNSMFCRMGFADKHDDYFLFLPNRWPYFIQQDITTPHEKPTGSVRELAEETLVYQDVVEYSQMLTGRIKRLLKGGFSVLCKAYHDFRNFDPTPEVISSIRKNSKSFTFRYFES